MFSQKENVIKPRPSLTPRPLTPVHFKVSPLRRLSSKTATEPPQKCCPNILNPSALDFPSYCWGCFLYRHFFRHKSYCFSKCHKVSRLKNVFSSGVFFPKKVFVPEKKSIKNGGQAEPLKKWMILQVIQWETHFRLQMRLQTSPVNKENKGIRFPWRSSNIFLNKLRDRVDMRKPNDIF